MADAPRRYPLPADYVPPTVWSWDRPSGGQFASINRPIAGPTHDKALPVGAHPLQLYSLGTPNGQKVTILLEELLAAGHAGAEYDAWYIDIGEGDQFAPGSPAQSQFEDPGAARPVRPRKPQRVFESGRSCSTEKFGAFPPVDPAARTEALNWLFWQIGSAPSWAAVSAISTCMRRSRSNMLSTATRWRPSASSTCSTAISPIIALPPATSTASPTWRSGHGTGRSRWAVGDAATFLSTSDYRHFNRWVEEVAARPAVQRGRRSAARWRMTRPSSANGIARPI